MYKYSYFTRFEELTPKSEEEMNEWISNRKKTYFNSMRYFFRSLFYKELEKEKFTLYAGKLNNLLIGLGIWISPDNFKLEYSSDSTLADFSFDKCIKVIRDKESIINFGSSKITIDSYGNLISPMFVQTYRWWSHLRLADLLPYDYVGKK